MIWTVVLLDDILSNKKSLKIDKRESEAVNRSTENTMTENRQRMLHNTLHSKTLVNIKVESKPPEPISTAPLVTPVLLFMLIFRWQMLNEEMIRFDYDKWHISVLQSVTVNQHMVAMLVNPRVLVGLALLNL